MYNEIDRKKDVTTILFLLVQNRYQTHDWTLIGSGANELGIQEWIINLFVSPRYKLFSNSLVPSIYSVGIIPDITSVELSRYSLCWLSAILSLYQSRYDAVVFFRYLSFKIQFVLAISYTQYVSIRIQYSLYLPSLYLLIPIQLRSVLFATREFCNQAEYFSNKRLFLVLYYSLTG